MAKYKPTSTTQGILTPVHLSHQIQEGIFEYTLTFWWKIFLIYQFWIPVSR
jgi:hypothetical protein